MTENESRQIQILRAKQFTCAQIADETGLPLNTVKSYLRRHPVATQSVCLQCGKPVTQTPHRKEKKFCSDRCRLRWWNNHPERITHRAVQTKMCLCCGAEFVAYRNEKQKYCSRECYNLARKPAA